MSDFFRFKKFLIYQWKAKTKYYLHSPFVYQFYINVLEGKKDENLRSIDLLRRQLKSDHSFVAAQDFGTGVASSRKISDLEGHVAVRKKYGEMLYRLVKYFQPKTIVEIGTSIGISTGYLALANPSAKIVTLEGSSTLIYIAEQNFSKLGINNIETVCGNFGDTLPNIIQGIYKLDMVLFDGNHTKEATLRYFKECLPKTHENSIFIFDDIYWNSDMNEAWEEIKANTEISLTIDVFQYGICFFTKGKLAKENFILRY